MKMRRVVISGMVVAALAVGAWGVVRVNSGRGPGVRVGGGGSVAVGAVTAATVTLATDPVHPLVQQFCFQCHGEGQHKGDLALDAFKNVGDVRKDKKTWELVLENVRKGEMPPPDAKVHPTLAQREELMGWVEREVYQFDPAHPDPGRVTIHRLNRSEYNNTIRDLVGVNFQPADDFPSDDSGYGFDNIGDVLSLPPVLMEKYLTAAGRVMDEAIVTETRKSVVRHFNGNLMEMGFNADGDRGDGWMPLGALEEDGLATAIPVAAGDYIVRVHAFVRTRGAGGGGGRGGAATQAGQGDEGAEGPAPVPAPVAAGAGLKLGVMIDNSVAHDFTVTGTEANPGTYEYRVGVADGKHRFAVVNRRLRGGADELLMKNGRIGREQGGVVWVKWVEVEGPLPSATRRFAAGTLNGGGKSLAEGGRYFEKNGEVSATFKVAKAGNYVLRAEAYADQAGSEPARMEWKVNGKSVKVFDVTAPGALVAIQGQRVFSTELLKPLPYVYEMPLTLEAGEQTFTAGFINAFADAGAQNPNLRKRALTVDYLEVVAVDEAPALPAMPAALARNFTAKAGGVRADKGAAAREVLGNFARRAWRRPVTAGELDRLITLFERADKGGGTFEGAMKLPMKAVLVSPDFLFRGVDDVAGVHLVDEFALASRLSYFLWSSTPDDELLNLAEKGELRKNLTVQVKRMLGSPKASALAENFAGQWLQFRNLKFVAPDAALFPEYGPGLRDAMRQETVLFFDAVMRENRSVLDFINGDFTFVNGALAGLYGIPGVTGSEFQKVSLANLPRRGILTQGSVLTITSNPTRTSPVKRGKWVLENILGTPPPPPPPDVPELKNDGHADTASLRQQMEQHRATPACASCHLAMDPLGFGLEQFDGIGKWREKDGEFAVDSSGVLVTGEKFNGAVELANLLAKSKREEFLHCLAEKMLTYAVGRGMEYYDRPAVTQIVKGMESDDLKFERLIMEVVNSLPFQQCRGDSPAAAK